jgi:mannose-6-phosphate isomerase-like protein (cupin superfamily)
MRDKNVGRNRMPITWECIDALPFDEPTLQVLRNEELLLTAPAAPATKLWQDYEPLAVYRFPTMYEPVGYAPPRGVFEGPYLRLEWQTMNFRQPFYHRNTDVDELSFQVCGERTLMTEFGTVELRPGDFTRIPVGVAHDNFGRRGIHLLFYLHGPAQACVESARTADYKVPAFDGWQPKRLVEVMTHCLGGPHCDVAASLIDEELLLKEAERSSSRIEVIKAGGNDGELAWLYKAPKVWIGHTVLEKRAVTRRYTRHRCADEIQYQVRGRRTLVTQRGTVTLDPGEFVYIPFGCAFASVVEEASEHISVLSSERAAPVPEPVRRADVKSLQFLVARDAALSDA